MLQLLVSYAVLNSLWTVFNSTTYIQAPPTDAIITIRKVGHKSELSIRVVSCQYVHQKEPKCYHDTSTLEMDGASACVIAQQYSSAAFFSLHFHYLNEKSRAVQDSCYFKNLLLFLKWRKSEIEKLHKLGRVCRLNLFAVEIRIQ